MQETLHAFNHSSLFQVNAQVLVSTFCKESQPLMRLGEAMGAVLQSCAASHKPISSVQITTEGKAATRSPLPAHQQGLQSLARSLLPLVVALQNKHLEEAPSRLLHRVQQQC